MIFKKTFLLTVFFMLAILLSACSLYGTPSGQSSIQIPTGSKVVEITATGFIPSSLTIKAGETVTFVNKDTKAHWPASAMHPTHLLYPESGGCIGSKFDACRGLNQDENFS